jgi:MFS family permease
VARPVRVWWIPPFLGRVPDIEPRLVSLLGLVSLALFFESYDMSMLTSALRYIASDLGMTEGELGGYLGTIRLGALPAFFLVPFADRIGRRRVFLVTVIGTSIGTLLTAFTQTPLQFVAAQMFTRAFLLAGAAVAVVIITEEFPAEHRGWAIGMLGALSACGHGLGAVLFAQIERLPYGWRALYAIGVLPLLLLPMFRRGVTETHRFTKQRAHHGDAPVEWYQPLVRLAAAYPTRAGAMGVVALLLGVGEVSVFQYSGYFVQTAHGWAPGQYSLMVLLGGGVGIIGNIVAGRLGDRIGRRRTGMLFLGAFPIFAILFYNGPSWVLPVAFACIVFSQTAGGTIVRALSTELFPTSQRGTASGWVTLMQTLGWALGLWLVGLGTHGPGDLARMTSLASFGVLASATALLLLPETHRRELETISSED